MATIKQKGDLYIITVSNGKGSDGKYKRIYESYKPISTTPRAIAREVQLFADNLEKQVRDGEYRDGHHIKFKDYIEEWNRKWAIDNLTIRVREDYLGTLKSKFVPDLGEMYLSDIKPIDIQDIVYYLHSEKKLKRVTIKKALSILNSVMGYAYSLEVIDRNPCEKIILPKEKEEEVPEALKHFEKEQAKRFLDFLSSELTFKCKGHSRMVSSSGEKCHVSEYSYTHKIHPQFKVYFNLAIYGGFRRGELLGLTWEAINFDTNEITISQSVSAIKGKQIVKAPKTKSSYRTVTMGNTCMKLLAEWKKAEQEQCMILGSAWEGFRGKDFDKNFVFITDTGSGMNLGTPSHKFKELLEIYNNGCTNEEEKLPEITLHDLRHTCATLGIANGMDIETVSKRLGHSKASITMDIYGHATKENDKKFSDKMEELLGNSRPSGF